ncbi:hypothetical protein HSIEG1_3240 [Enterococcus sp. HSIEG1]|nr:hypothetical protein HSIEG1_3240 [Enterococcus sp. HSIEG1]
MANNQLDKTIQAGFQEERENVRDHSEEKKKGKLSPSCFPWLCRS